MVKDLAKTQKKGFFLKFNYILLATIIALLALNAYFILEIRSDTKKSQKQLAGESFRYYAILGRNVGRWSSANFILQTILHHREKPGANNNDLRIQLEEMKETDPGSNFFFSANNPIAVYDRRVNQPANLKYPRGLGSIEDSISSLHIWSNALCAQGKTIGYTTVTQGDKYSQNQLRAAGAKDFAIVYAAEKATVDYRSLLQIAEIEEASGESQKEYIKCLDTQSGFDSPDFLESTFATPKGVADD